MNKILTGLLMLASIISASDAFALDNRRVPENRVIYEVFVRNFSPAGNFKGVEAQVDRIAELGADVVWLMPIYKLGDVGKWGPYSSPYAVKNYKEIDPDNGTAQDLHDLISAIHAAGMEVWFDWVGNHTSMDNVWVSQHPEFYKKDNRGQFTNPNGWGDVYQLDVDNHAMHEAMIEAMKYWVDEFDIDGYRCDYASGPSQEFWREATEQVTKDGKRIAWLAEDDSEPELVTNGWFDYNWTWGFFGAMHTYWKNPSSDNLAKLRRQAASLHTDNRYKNGSRVMYTSSHDVVQDYEDGYRTFGNLIKPYVVMQFTVYGCPVIYNGQEINYQGGQAMLAHKTPINWNSGDASMTKLYQDLARLKHSHPSLLTGIQSASFTNLTTSSQDKIFAYMRGEGRNAVVVLLNLSGSQVNNFSVQGLPEGSFTELFSGEEKSFANSESFSLPAYGYAVYSSVAAVPVETHNFYFEDKTGWGNLYLYAWANDSDSIYGGWPGVKASETVSIDGGSWYAVPFSATGQTVNLIYNNNSGSQKDIFDITLDKDYFFTIYADRYEEVEGMGTDVSEVEVTIPNEKEVIYYNLQGMRVSKPSKGVYIKVTGDKATRVLF